MKKGLDISKHQRGLSLLDVKNAGYDFVILRGAYSGYGADRTKHKDNCFEDFYRQAKNLGLKVGAYFYSCAKTKDEGIAEAKFFYENALQGKQFEMPVYIDVEDETWQSKDKKGVTDATIGFCDYLESLGFYVGIYASLYWFNARLETERLTGYTKWVAKWTTGANEKPTVGFNAFDMWQYTSKGCVAGVRVDEDICYIDFESIIKRVGKNGYEPSTAELPTPPQPINPDTEPKEDVKESIYFVKQGDTLSKIARKYKTTVKALVEKNGIKDKNKIYIGQVIRL